MKKLLLIILLFASPLLAQYGVDQTSHPANYVYNGIGWQAPATPSIPNLILFAADYIGADPASGGIQACINALPARGGTCDARGVGTSGALTVTEDIVLGSDSKAVTVLLGHTSITLSGAQIKLFNGSTIIGQGTDDPSRAPSTYISGNSSSPLITYGDASNQTPNYYVNLSNFRVRNTGTGAAIELPSISSSTFDHVVAVSAGTYGISIGGTPTCACYNSFYQIHAQGASYGIQIGATANQNQFIAGGFGGPIGVYVNGGFANTFYSNDYENNTSHSIEIASGDGNNFYGLYFEGSGPVLLDSGVRGNSFAWGGGAGSSNSVTDNSGNGTNIIMLTAGSGNGNYGQTPSHWAVQKYFDFNSDWNGDDVNENERITNQLHSMSLDFNYPATSSPCVNYSKCGSTVPLYAGPYNGVNFSTGSAAPTGSCTAPAVYWTTAGAMYNCQSGAWVAK